MSFSSGFLAAIVYLALVWCALTGVGLAALLVRDMRRGDVW